jgi:exonuclease VII small subunit
MAGSLLHIERLVFQLGKNEFERCADDLQQWLQKMTTLTEQLHTQGWLGDASNREHAEAMSILLKRLQKAVHASQAGAQMFPSLQTKLQQAEDEAKSLFSQWQG